MKKILLFFFTFVCINVFSQRPELSESFPEPRDWSKIIQLKNNNTFLVEFTLKKGVTTALYDHTRKKIYGGTLPLTLVGTKFGRNSVSGTYEMGGDLVMFIQAIDDRIVSLVRIIVDGKTGQLKSEEKIAELDQLSRGAGYALAYGDVDIPAIKVEKDPDSDYYAVIRYNTLAAETKDRIEVLHFSPEHKIINRANYVSPNDKYKFTKYLSCYVKKDEFIIMATYAFNTKKSGGENGAEGRFYISQLQKGANKFIQTELEYKDYYKNAACKFLYNKPKNAINLMLITDKIIKDKDQSGYVISFQNLNLSNLQFEKPYQLDFSSINDIYKNKMNRKYEYEGLPHGAYIDNDGNMNIILHQTTWYIQQEAGFSFVRSTYLGDVAILTVSSEGKTVNSNVFSCNISRVGKQGVFSYCDNRNGVRNAEGINNTGTGRNLNLSLDMVCTAQANYIFFNNANENMKLTEADEARITDNLNLVSAVKYTYNKTGIKKEFIFDPPKDIKDGKFCNFSAADYNTQTKTYASLVTDPKTKTTSLVWLKLD